MPTLSEMLVQGSQESAQQTGNNFLGGVKAGSQLAESINNMQIQRQQIEQKKDELQMHKAIAVTDTLKIAASSKDKNLKNFLLKNVLPSKVKALGMEKFFTPESMQMIQTSDSALAKVLGLQLDLDNKVQRKEITGAEAYQIAQRTLSDPEELAMLDTDKLFEAQKFGNDKEAKFVNAQLVQTGQNVRQATQIASAGKQEIARSTGKEYTDWETAGGKATFNKNLNKLENAAKILESGQLKTGKISAALPLLGTDKAQDVLNPEIAKIRDDVRGAIQASLRQTLGAQFTEQEGEAIFNRSFNPRLSADENARRIRAEINGLKEMAVNKENSFESQGFKVKNKVMNDYSQLNRQQLDNHRANLEALKGDKTKTMLYLQKLADALNITIEQVKKKLGVE